MNTLIRIYVDEPNQTELEALLTDLGEVLVEKGYTTDEGMDSFLKSMIIVSDASKEDVEVNIEEGSIIIIPTEAVELEQS